jgi:MTH538 TIR-like domain (DUF1863)
MARRCFFSFHYQRDVWRAWQVKNAWVTKPDREDAGFFNASAFEASQREGDEALKRFLTKELEGSSVVCALIGAETAWRRWVRYELVRGFQQGKALLGVKIHQLRNQDSMVDFAGTNVLECLGYELDESNVTIRFKHLTGGKWEWFSDLPTMQYSALPYVLPNPNATFAYLFNTYDYVDGRGYENIGGWIEAAAKSVGR